MLLRCIFMHLKCASNKVMMKMCFTTNSFAAVAKKSKLSKYFLQHESLFFSTLLLEKLRKTLCNCQQQIFTFQLQLQNSQIISSLQFSSNIIKVLNYQAHDQAFSSINYQPGSITGKKPRLSSAPGSLTNALAVRKKREGQAGRLYITKYAITHQFGQPCCFSFQLC